MNLLLFFFTILFICELSHEEAELIDSRLQIQRFWGLSTKESDLKFTFVLEQGLVVPNSNDLQLRILNSSTHLELFHDIIFDSKSSHQIGPTEASYQNNRIVGIRRKFDTVIGCLHNDQFPFDSHTCTWTIRIMGKPKDELDLRWSPSEVSMEDTALPEVVLHKVTPTTCTYHSSPPSAFFATYTRVLHGCLSVVIEFRRSFTIPLTRLFVPTSLALFLSWLAFYTRRTDLLPRVILPIASILMQILLALNYLTAVSLSTSLTPADVWCIMLTGHSVLVIAFLFLIAMVEARSRKYVHLSNKDATVRKESMARHVKKMSRNLDPVKDQEQSKCISFDQVMSHSFRQKADKNSLIAVRIQIVARILCPLCYVVSTILFFVLYLIRYH